MKHVDICCCRVGAYRTPWCQLLHSDEENECEVLHLFYKIPVLQEDIERRSSMLGKLRRTEEAQHLLDLIALTKDEEDLFSIFARAAMADVFDALQLYAPKLSKGYFWREGLSSFELGEAVGVVTESEGEEDVLALNGEEVRMNTSIVPFKKDDYVRIGDQWYVAAADGDTTDWASKLIPTEDYRNSIHYVLRCKCRSNLNMIEPIDTAIFEALVARIIFKWLEYAYPDEAPRYNAAYEEEIAKLRKRCDQLWGTHIVHRIPRMF